MPSGVDLGCFVDEGDFRLAESEPEQERLEILIQRFMAEEHEISTEITRKALDVIPVLLQMSIGPFEIGREEVDEFYGRAPIARSRRC